MDVYSERGGTKFRHGQDGSDTPSGNLQGRGSLKCFSRELRRCEGVAVCECRSDYSVPEAEAPVRSSISEHNVSLIEDVNRLDSEGNTLLVKAVLSDRSEEVKRLIKRGANINRFDYQGGTPLTKQVLSGCTENVQRLIKAGADINRHDYNGHTPLMIAARKNNVDIVKILLGAVSTKSGNTPKSLEKPHDGNSVAESAPLEREKAEASTTTENIAILLVEKMVDINKRDKRGNSPLHIAIDKKSYEVAKLLIESKAEVNTSNICGWTPLISACNNNHEESVKLLLEKGAKVDQRNSVGSTAILLAAAYDSERIVRMLMDRNADILISNHDKWFPLLSAIKNNRLGVIKQLLSVGWDKAIPGKEGRVWSVAAYYCDKPTLEYLFHYRQFYKGCMFGVISKYTFFDGVNNKSSKTPLQIIRENHGYDYLTTQTGPVAPLEEGPVTTLKKLCRKVIRQFFDGRLYEIPLLPELLKKYCRHEHELRVIVMDDDQSQQVLYSENDYKYKYVDGVNNKSRKTPLQILRENHGYDYLSTQTGPVGPLEEGPAMFSVVVDTSAFSLSRGADSATELSSCGFSSDLGVLPPFVEIAPEIPVATLKELCRNVIRQLFDGRLDEIPFLSELLKKYCRYEDEYEDEDEDEDKYHLPIAGEINSLNFYDSFERG